MVLKIAMFSTEVRQRSTRFPWTGDVFIYMLPGRFAQGNAAELWLRWDIVVEKSA